MDGGLLKEASDRLLISKGQNNSSLLDGVDGGLLKEASDWLLISRGQNNGSLLDGCCQEVSPCLFNIQSMLAHRNPQAPLYIILHRTNELTFYVMKRSNNNDNTLIFPL